MATVRPGHRPVLLVVDVQVGVMAEAWEADRVIANVARAVARARADAVPVVWVQHEAPDLPRDGTGWPLVPALQPADGEARIDKRHESSFEATGLEPLLATLGATHLVLAGASTNWCIRATAHAALDRGYDLTLVGDAHTTGPAAQAPVLVDDLNAVMHWMRYPGRHNRVLGVEAAGLWADPAAPSTGA